jgi:hypothetical protein
MVMATSRGFCYAAYGDKAMDEARLSIATLKECNDYPVTMVGSKPLNGTPFVHYDDMGLPGRWAKLNMDSISPYETTCYIDADTRVYASLQIGFDIVDDGWDLAITPSAHQGTDIMWHIKDDEREATLLELGNWDPLQLQGGVFFFRKSPEMLALFAAWRDEWQRWRDKDQAALLRALYKSPVRLWLLGRCYNGGSIVMHRFGAFR